MEKLIGNKCERLLVVAIHIGTNYSKWAFSTTCDWNNVKMCLWIDEFDYSSRKAPTCLVLKKDQLKSWFGYEAKMKYSELMLENRHHDYHFLERFATCLNEDFFDCRHIVCKDIENNPLEAGVVFKHCIRHLKRRISESIERVTGVSDGDIQFILTVPAISGEKAKNFMKEVALSAGIKKENLSVVLEPEAASIYCQYSMINDDYSTSASLGVLKPGTKYILADIGGDTADMFVHQIREDDTLEEILPASRGPWGGKSVDDQFITFLKELFGKDVLEKSKKENMEDYFDMIRDFERRKRNFKPEMSGKTRLNIPFNFLELCGVDDFKEVIQKNDKHRNNVEVRFGRIVLDNNFFKGFFKKTIDGIVKHIDEIFQEYEARDINKIVMVGGFSSCLLVQDAIRQNFTNATVIVPADVEFAVLNGAVYFGHICDAVSWKSARYRYGTQ